MSLTKTDIFSLKNTKALRVFFAFKTYGFYYCHKTAWWEYIAISLSHGAYCYIEKIYIITNPCGQKTHVFYREDDSPPLN